MPGVGSSDGHSGDGDRPARVDERRVEVLIVEHEALRSHLTECQKLAAWTVTVATGELTVKHGLMSVQWRY